MSPFDPDLQSLAWALIHFLWQGCLIWAFTALSFRLTRKSSAQLRYVLGVLGLALCMALPIGTFLKLRPRALQRASFQTVTRSIPKVPVLSLKTPGMVVNPFQGWTRQMENSTRSYLPWIIRVWFLGSLLLALRLGGGWIGIQLLHRKARVAPREWQQRLKHMSKALRLWQSPRFLLLNQIHSPLVVGWVRPLLLMPASFLSGLDPTAVEALLAHELAHIKRHDYLVNFTQCVVEILLFYHPAVWWISRRVRTERELCCDDVAVAWCEDPRLYAETLNQLHELRSRSFAPALAAGGGDLMFRIKRLLIPSPIQSGTPRRFNLAALTCSTALLLSAGFATHLLSTETPLTKLQGSWFLAGSNSKAYQFTSDPTTTHNGQPSQLLSRTTEETPGFGTVMQNRIPTEFLGKRVRMSAWVKAQDVKGWAGLWMRVDGKGNGTPLAADNMSERPIQGTLDWKRYEVVLDIAPTAQNLALGLLMDGKGRIWMNDLKLEVVDPQVSTTGGGLKEPPSEFNPTAWNLSGPQQQSYLTRLDSDNPFQGKPSHVLASAKKVQAGFGMLMQMFKGAACHGKRVRLSAWVKSENVQDHAGLWMNVLGQLNGQPESTAFDNMENRPIKGNSPWRKVEIVLDVASETQSISLGLLLKGAGRVWMAEPTLEIVDPSVPLTMARP